jgi:hypothetical protein
MTSRLISDPGDKSYKAFSEVKWLQNQGFTFNEINKKVSTWHGHYIQGTQGYLEIFSASEMAAHPYITQPSAIGFYTEEIGSLDRIHAELLKSNSAQSIFKVYENFFSRQTYIGLANIATWVMEVKPSFLGANNIKRETWSKFFRDKKNTTQQPAISNFKSIYLDVNNEEKSRMAQVLTTLGYNKSSENTWSGPETTIVIGNTAPFGIKKVIMRLSEGALTKSAINKNIGSARIKKEKASNEISFSFNPQTPKKKKL